MSEYVHPIVVGFRVNERDEVAGKIFRGSDAEEKSRDYYHELVEKGLDCFRAQMKEEHCEG